MRAADIDIDYERDSPEHRARAGGDWTNNGPLLRNMPAGNVHSHYWSVLETIIWVATRDERAIAGAAGYLRDRQNGRSPVGFGIPSQVILATELRIDVEGHHLDCPAMWEVAPCECTRLGRARYCQCPASSQIQPDWICPCVDRAVASVERAILDGLPVSGQLEAGHRNAPTGQHENCVPWVSINLAALAGAKRWFDRTGMRFVPGYINVRVRKAAAVAKWPPRPVPEGDRAPTRPVGRPALYLEGLRIYRDRLAAGRVLRTARAEAGEIRKVHPDKPTLKAVEGWLRKVPKLAWKEGLPANAAEVICKIDTIVPPAERGN